MMFERGPVAFVKESRNFVRKTLSEDSSAVQHLCQLSSSHMSHRIRVLMELRSALASFLAQVIIIIFFLFIMCSIVLTVN